ncbi:MAG: BatA and WFA domain-containing protein [Anaerolineae bacterium]|nr:BatA and WFA domain-containing protein [Anaerolineae bacterium]MDQ7034718.1 BatA and WFA domain-containing protein [Anaerolineae bacterium]
MSFLSPFAFLGAVIAIPIILLYMLRLRRREVVISSNFLWEQILRDREANTPWQRLRRNILLILQLIILALIVLAMARPAQIVPTISAGKTVILLDASASMNATDIDGQSRFEEAKRQAVLVLSEVGLEDEVAVIRVADVTEPIITYTHDINALRRAINNAEPGSGSGDWDTALTLAAAGAEGAEDFSIIIVTDGGLGNTARLPENIPQPNFIVVGQANNNLAISALATRALPGQIPQLFAQVQNYNNLPTEMSLLIRLDGEIWESITQLLAAQSQRAFVFTVEEDFTTIEAELVLDDEVIDYLDIDNQAYTVATDNRTRRVLLLSEQRNIFLEQVLRSLPGVQLFRGDTTRSTLPESQYDLYVFNNYLPDDLPDADMLIVNPSDSTELFTILGDSEESGRLQIADGARSHPLTTFLNVSNVSLRTFKTMTVGSWANPIIDVQGGTIVYAGEDDGRQIVLMPFNLLDSDLPLQIAFPLLMSNAMEWFAPANIVSGGTAYSVGDLVRVNPPLDATDIRIILPDGSVQNLDMAGDNVSFGESHIPGFYTIEILSNGEITDTQTISVNIFGSGESNIAPVAAETIEVGGGAVDSDAEEQLGFREYWSWIATLALIMLLLEWVVYFRRMRVPESIQVDLRRTTARN